MISCRIEVLPLVVDCCLPPLLPAAAAAAAAAPVSVAGSFTTPISPISNSRTTREMSLPPPLLGISRGAPPSRRGGKEAASEEEEEAPLAPPSVSLPHNWLCRRRRQCADVVAVDAHASLPSSRLRLSPLAIVALVTRHRAGVVVIIVVVFVIAVVVASRRAVAIVVDFVARRAVAIVRRHRDEGNNAIATTAKSVAASK
jgi:hypothetical protein